MHSLSILAITTFLTMLIYSPTVCYSEQLEPIIITQIQTGWKVPKDTVKFFFGNHHGNRPHHLNKRDLKSSSNISPVTTSVKVSSLKDDKHQGPTSIAASAVVPSDINTNTLINSNESTTDAVISTSTSTEDSNAGTHHHHHHHHHYYQAASSPAAPNTTIPSIDTKSKGTSTSSVKVSYGPPCSLQQKVSCFAKFSINSVICGLYLNNRAQIAFGTGCLTALIGTTSDATCINCTGKAICTFIANMAKFTPLNKKACTAFNFVECAGTCPSLPSSSAPPHIQQVK